MYKQKKNKAVERISESRHNGKHRFQVLESERA